MLASGIAVAVFANVRAQSFYVDLDVGGGDAGIGSGAPSSAFGAASGIPGFWNRVQADSPGPIALADTSGVSGSLSLTALGGSGAFGYRNTNNTGDFALLFNDGEDIDGGVTYTITGIRAGQYRIFSYAARPQGNVVNAFVSVTGSSTQNPQVVTGPQTGNLLQQGVTYCIHDVQVTGSLVIHAEGGVPGNNAYMNGFQVVAVPEPLSGVALAGGIGLLLRRRRRTCRTAGVVWLSYGGSSLEQREPILLLYSPS